MTYSFGRSSLLQMNTIWPEGCAVLNKALSLNIMDFGVTNGGRTQASQDRLYEQGRTTAGDIVTWTRNSNHLIAPSLGHGFAFDVVPYIDEKDYWYFKTLFPSRKATSEYLLTTDSHE